MTSTTRRPEPAPARRSRLDPDALAALQDERDFLARSLADLEREHDAGDIDEADYAGLRDDYVARTATVLRAIEDRRTAAHATRVRRSPVRVGLVILGVLAFALASGVLVARLAGTRTSTGSLTGDIRASSRQQLQNCTELAGTAMAQSSTDTLLQALRCYDGVLATQPSNAQALSYRGWLLVRTGDERLATQGMQNLDAAVAAAPTYADAAAFRTIVYYRSGRLPEARAELDRLVALRPPAMMLDLLDQFGVREGIAAGAATGGNATATTAVGGG